MSPARALAADHADAFAHFGAEQVPECSAYPYSPVFPCRIGERAAVIKRTRKTRAAASAVAAATREWVDRGVGVVTPLDLSVANPVQLGDFHWVAYPFIEGRAHSGRIPDIAAAGTLLGRIHASGAGSARLPAFRWPDYDQARVDADVLPSIRDARLPYTNACMDYKANNLVYTPAGPVLVHPDNGDFAPRLLDLAQAALLFHTAPARPFDRTQWSAFIRAYQREVDLTDRERMLWPTAIEYMLSEEGHWAFTGTPDDWHLPRQRLFLLALANARSDDFPLP